MQFSSLGLHENILKAVEKAGYSQPTPIQEKAIPAVLKGGDVLASAQTGTGKTAGFTLPILQLLSQQEREGKRTVKALILTPTRELASQIYNNVRQYAEFLDIRSAVIFGGVNINPQKATLRNGVDILIATPGRLLDLYTQKAVRLNEVQILVLDEADRMLDMGFSHDIKRVLNIVPKKRQNLLFSATFSNDIKALADKLLNNPVTVSATPENTTVEIIKQRVIRVDKEDKTNLLTQLIITGNWEQVLVFTRTKHGADRLAKRLAKAKIESAAIHGDKGQGARTRALASFKEGTCKVLVATDIAARGLDIPELPHVVNFELPQVAEDYVHRIGRTGRAGMSGVAISLVCIDEMQMLGDIEKLIGLTIPQERLEGFEPKDIPAEVKHQNDRRHSKPGNKRRFGSSGNGGGKKKSNRDQKFAQKQKGKSGGKNR